MTLLSTHTTPSGFVLPSIHAAPPFFTQQPNPTTHSSATNHWSRLILSYARYRKLFILKVDNAEVPGGEWDEVLRNERINRKVLPTYLSKILEEMVAKNQATWEPPKQTRSVLLYWNTPEQWADLLYDWGTTTGQLNTILTYYDITDPPVESPLSGIEVIMLRKAIAILNRTGRAQVISVADGEGVKLLPRTGK